MSGPALVARLRADPDDADAWRVYADWLLDQGDPRGRLVAAQLQGDLGIPADLFDFAYGPVAAHLNRRVDVTWACGFWRRVRCSGAALFRPVGSHARGWGEDGPVGDVVREVLAHPSAAFLRALHVGLGTDIMPTEALGQLDPHPTVSFLYLGDFVYPDQSEISWVDIGDVTEAMRAFPRLTGLTVQGAGIHVERLPSRLERLHLYSGGLPAQPVRMLAAADLPALADLELWLGDEMYGAEVDAQLVEALLHNERLVGLRRLGLCNAELSNALPGLLAASPLLPRLRQLSFAKGTLTGPGAAALIASAGAFRHLESIDLSDNGLEEPWIGRLQEALPQVEIGEQKETFDDIGGPTVYVSVGE